MDSTNLINEVRRIWCIVDAPDEGSPRTLVSIFETRELASLAYKALHDEDGFPINPGHGTYELDSFCI